MDDTIVESAWYVDSETGDEVLIDLEKKKIIARRVKGVIQETV